MKLLKIHQKIKSKKELVSLIVILLTLITLTKCSNILINFRLLNEDNAYHIYNAIQTLESVILPTVSFFLCNRKRYNLRAILLAVVIFNSCCFLQYFLVYFYPRYFYITIILFTLIVIPFIYRFIIISLYPYSDRYMDGYCYLAYKKPVSITGSICSLLTAPYGHCSLIVCGREFSFKHGIMVEQAFELTNELTFRKIKNIPISEVRKLLGMKWSIKNNCFSTFNKFKNI